MGQDHYSEVPIGAGTFYVGDCFDVMRDLPAASVDMILCDLPYGTTQNKWDSVLPLDRLWKAYERVCKPGAAIVLTAAQPFTSVLVSSNLRDFKYDWAWKKPKGTGHLNAKKQPMRDKEDIVIFCREQGVYNPQFTAGEAYKARPGKHTDNTYGSYETVREDNPGRRYPKQVLEFPIVERNKLHPSQKPVELFEYMIRTYSEPGYVVLDNTAGSGTTAVAAENAGRRWICIERDDEYAAKAIQRIREHVGETVDPLIAMFG